MAERRSGEARRRAPVGDSDAAMYGGLARRTTEIAARRDANRRAGELREWAVVAMTAVAMTAAATVAMFA